MHMNRQISIALCLMVAIVGFLAVPSQTRAEIDLEKGLNDLKDALPVVGAEIPIPALNEAENVNTEPIVQGLNMSLGEVWDSMNGWLNENVGISLSEIVNTILTFVIWAFELVVKLLKAIIELLPTS